MKLKHDKLPSHFALNLQHAPLHLVLVPVYRGGVPEEGGVKVGDVALAPDTTVGSLRATLQDQFQLHPGGFRLCRCRLMGPEASSHGRRGGARGNSKAPAPVPIHPGQDHHAAVDFFNGPADALVILD